jgi:hypothetical protein
MVGIGVVLLRRVTLGADRVAVGAQLARVRLVAVAAGHARVEHAALQERAPGEHFVALLAVGVIEPRVQQRRPIVIQERGACAVALGDLAAARMALRADLHLDVGRARRAAHEIAGRRVRLPARAAAFVEPDGQAPRRVRGTRLRQLDVHRSRPVARFAADGDLGIRGAERVRRRVVVLAHVGRMTVRAHEVPVLRAAGPVQLVAVVDAVVRIQVEPALPAPFARTRVPRDRQRLHAAVGELDQVLLERLDAERVLDLEVGEAAVRAVGAHVVAAVAAEEPRLHARVAEAGVGEVAEHGRLGGVLHRPRVLRALPEPGLGGMTARARVGTHEARGSEIRTFRARARTRRGPFDAVARRVGRTVAAAGERQRECERRDADDALHFCRAG